MEENYLQELNEQQREAVLYSGGPSLVIAGAGSGKTRVLTYKIAYLLASGDYSPYQILALTFTNKAAREMKERIASVVGGATASRLWMGTFHSIFSRILRTNAERIGFSRDFTIYDQSDSRSLIKTVIKEMLLDDKVYKPATVQAIISNAKNALITPSAYAANAALLEADMRSKRPQIRDIYKIYWSRCTRAGAMDFDDLLLYTNILFRDHPDVLEFYQNQFRYVLVDEYQDTNFAQHLIVNQLVKAHHRLCVVGDDAQSIYSFRGANISNILNLQKEYPDFRIFKLEQNYRSTQTIVAAANSLIAKNKEQIPKHIFSHNAVGAKIPVVSAYSDFEEGYLIANRIATMRVATVSDYSDFAILYRTNSQSRIFEEALRKRNIPYRIYGGQSFYQRKEIKDVVAYFRLAVNPADEEALKRIINYPARGIGNTTVAKIVACAETHEASLWDVVSRPVEYALGVNAGTQNKLMAFAELIRSFVEMNATANAYDLADAVIRRSGIMTDIYADRSPENMSRQENVQELLNGIQEFCSLRQEEGVNAVSLSDFLAEVSLATDQDSDKDGDDNRVTLMTVHASKGLEFRHVFVVGLEEELFPAAMSMGSAGSWRRSVVFSTSPLPGPRRLACSRMRHRVIATVNLRPLHPVVSSRILIRLILFYPMARQIVMCGSDPLFRRDLFPVLTGRMKMAGLFPIPNRLTGFLSLPPLLVPERMHSRSGCVSIRRPILRHHRPLRRLPIPEVLLWGCVSVMTVSEKERLPKCRAKAIIVKSVSHSSMWDRNTCY